ncbi:hypothetical protein ASD06_05090 [Angustibacter sp. Root456]|nr:hypothetical protein ASD06_05090 [Angustibacter sp. Root456]
MLARIRKAAQEKDSGFTLIELLVVMIIIGILAAIAIPVFLNQRKKAVDTSVKSDLRSIANEMETYYTDNQAYYQPATTTAGVSVSIGATSPTSVKVSSGNYFTFKLLKADGTVETTAANATGYCITGQNAKGDKAVAGLYYNSQGGGITTTACP